MPVGREARGGKRRCAEGAATGVSRAGYVGGAGRASGKRWGARETGLQGEESYAGRVSINSRRAIDTLSEL